jgi:hypothetical protein
MHCRDRDTRVSAGERTMYSRSCDPTTQAEANRSSSKADSLVRISMLILKLGVSYSLQPLLRRIPHEMLVQR